FEAFEQGEGIGGGPGEAGQHLAVIQTADLLGVAFHHGVAQGNLAVAAHDDFAVAAYGNDGGQGNISTLRGRWPECERIWGWFDGASSGVRQTSQALAPLSPLWGRLDAGRRSGGSRLPLRSLPCRPG